MNFNKRKCFFLLITFFCFAMLTAFTYDETRPVTGWLGMIEDYEINRRQEGIDLRGRIPVLNADEHLNDCISAIIDAQIAVARDSRARTVYFDYEMFFAEPFMSIVIQSTASGASSKTTVASVNFDVYSGATVTAAEAVGPHVVQLLDRLLLEMIRRNPVEFSSGFDGLRADQPFSVTRDEIVFWFDEFQLTPGGDGGAAAVLRFDELLEFVLESEYVRWGHNFNFVMVPLRDIAQTLGYDVEWDDYVGQIMVFHGNELVVALTPGENRYMRENRFTRTLEAAPELYNDQTYVPISFFDQILSLVAFDIDADDNIIFASYPVSDFRSLLR